MSEPVIRTRDLTKSFGDLVAVNRVNIEVERGEIYGLLGPNGAGKSTLIRMLTTLSRPTSGTAEVMGYDILKQDVMVRGKVGLVSEKMIMYDRLTAYENLRLFAKLYDVPKKEMEDRIRELVEIVDMTEWTDHQIGKFSTGMKQRINVIRALVSMPDLVFMDEPTLGLDPQSTSDIRKLIRDLCDDRGLTIILTTHIMNEAEMLCDRIGLINRGRIVAEGSPADLRSTIGERECTVVRMVLEDPPPDAADLLARREGVRSALQTENEIKVIHSEPDAFHEVMELAMDLGMRIGDATVSRPSLEDVFLHYTGTGLDAEKEMVAKRKVKGGPGPGHGRRSSGSRIR